MTWTTSLSSSRDSPNPVLPSSHDLLYRHILRSRKVHPTVSMRRKEKRCVFVFVFCLATCAAQGLAYSQNGRAARCESSKSWLEFLFSRRHPSHNRVGFLE